jgi:hypothetical protein
MLEGTALQTEISPKRGTRMKSAHLDAALPA